MFSKGHNTAHLAGGSTYKPSVATAYLFGWRRYLILRFEYEEATQRQRTELSQALGPKSLLGRDFGPYSRAPLMAYYI